MSSQKKVVTIKGEEVPISQCKKFNKEYYKIGDPTVKNSGDCYLVGDKYYREETKLIVFNYTYNKYVHFDLNTVEGVVDVIDNQLIFGYFNNSKLYSTVIDGYGKKYLVLDNNIFNNHKIYRERLSNGNYYHIQKLPAIEFSKIVIPNSGYKTSLPYDSKGILDSYLENYNSNYNPVISSAINNYAPILEELTFGLEFETTKGFVPKKILDQYGLIPLRDGSISGIEYVTVPMSGEKGLQAVCDITSVLKKRTEYDDKTCSMHLHLGNLPRTKEFIIAFFKVGMLIQDEVFEMFPLYKKYNYDIKNKNYSAPLPTFKILSKLDKTIDKSNIDCNFDVIYQYLSMGQRFESIENNIDNIIAHPADPNGTQKWNIKPRYLLYNLIPLLFGNKQTIEFRIHTPTYDSNKIMPFILMNALIVNFVIKHQNIILQDPNYLNELNLTDILNVQIAKYKLVNLDLLKDYMTDYVHYRKENVKHQTLNGDILGTESKIRANDNISWEKDVIYSKSKISPFNTDSNYISNYQPVSNTGKTLKYSKSSSFGLPSADLEQFFKSLQDAPLSKPIYYKDSINKPSIGVFEPAKIDTDAKF